MNQLQDAVQEVNVWFWLQNKVVEFSWLIIKSWETDDEGGTFSIQYERNDNVLTIKFYTPYVSDIFDTCLCLL